MNFQQHMTEDRRLTILILLSESADYSANEFLLQTALQGFGHSVSQDRLRSDIAWLREQELVTVKSLGSVEVVTLTKRGEDIAAGRATVPGVKRPRPKS